MKRSPTTVFSEWAEEGRDEKMAKGHEAAVSNMLDGVLKKYNSYRFIDAGCGNGWVVRLVNAHKDCRSAIGVDGSKKMIEKAQRIDPEGTYHHADLMNWIPEKRVEIVHSMEVIYYLKNPSAFLENVYNSWLTMGGILILGLDFYKENTVSHSWPEDCGVSIMHLFSEKHWIELFCKAGFKEAESNRFGVKENWSGTLILKGQK